MNRRSSARNASTLAIALGAAVVASGHAVATDPVAQSNGRPYSTLQYLDVKVDGGAGTERLTFNSAKPQRIAVAEAPLAVSFEEAGPDLVKMSVFEPLKNGRFRFIDQYYAGRDSKQTLTNFGVTMHLRFVDR